MNTLILLRNSHSKVIMLDTILVSRNIMIHQNNLNLTRFPGLPHKVMDYHQVINIITSIQRLPQMIVVSIIIKNVGIQNQTLPQIPYPLKLISAVHSNRKKKEKNFLHHQKRVKRQYFLHHQKRTKRQSRMRIKHILLINSLPRKNQYHRWKLLVQGLMQFLGEVQHLSTHVRAQQCVLLKICCGNIDSINDWKLKKVFLRAMINIL
mmetsp:Transcript_17489/g.20179  ORF Transcript_17489/g.20179 Transcript_17489/m.20179 type:complete len:207 (+) Transcript_17489:262-882(+)